MRKYLAAKAVLFIITVAFLANAQVPRTITVSGMVQDSATRLPVAGALVLLFDTNTIAIDPSALLNYKLDSTVSGTDGKFSYSMRVATNATLLGYAVAKQGYQTAYSATGILSLTVNLGVIKIAASTGSQRDTVTVSGTVLDSLTNAPIPGALVIMSGMVAIDTSSGNRVLTNADGTFSTQAIISKLNNVTMVGYVVSRVDYIAKTGEKTATGKQLDIGNIRLYKNAMKVLSGSRTSAAGNTVDWMYIYSLNGRLLYEGEPVMPIEKVLTHKSAPVLIVLKHRDRIVEQRKLVLTR